MQTPIRIQVEENDNGNLLDDLLETITYLDRPTPIILCGRGKERKGYAYQKSVKGRMQISLQSGQNSQVFYSFSIKGKSRGEMRFESKELITLLEKRGYTKENGYFK